MGKTAALEAQSTLEDRHMVGFPPPGENGVTQRGITINNIHPALTGE